MPREREAFWWAVGVLALLHLMLMVSWQGVSASERRPASMSLPPSVVVVTPTPAPSPTPRLLFRTETEVE